MTLRIRHRASSKDLTGASQQNGTSQTLSTDTAYAKLRGFFRPRLTSLSGNRKLLLLSSNSSASLQTFRFFPRKLPPLMSCLLPFSRLSRSDRAQTSPNAKSCLPLSSNSSTTQPQCQYLPQNVVALHTVSHRKLASLSGSSMLTYASL